ncbi:MAG: hypothetical protein AB1489_42355, partial [Acidobacteriota bacterium]
IAKAFESASTRLKEDPQDANALFVRAVSSEKLFLLKDAKSDYQNYLSIYSNSEHRPEVTRRLTSLTVHLNQNITAKPTSYEQLDRHIDDYLTALQTGNSLGASNALTGAEQIANEIAAKTGDRFGLDLVSYYRTVPLTNINQLREARKLRADVEAISIIDYFDDAIKKAGHAKTLFNSVGATCETLKTDVQLAKYLNKSDALKDAQILLDASIPQVAEKQYLFIHAWLLYWKGELHCNTSQFNQAIESYENCIRIAKPLDAPNFLVSPLVMLSSIYYTTNDNERAFELAYQAMETSLAIGRPLPIQLVQVMGISAFNLKFQSLAQTYLDHSVKLAEAQNNNSYLVMSHIFSGITQAEQHHTAEAEIGFAKAFEALSKIADQKARDRMEYAVTGYYARAQMIAGNVDKATELYVRSLELAEKTNLQQKLALSQLHQGLGECLIAKGNIDRAKIELEMAIAFDKEAQKNFEYNNALLTFAVSNKVSQELLRSLE